MTASLYLRRRIMDPVAAGLFKVGRKTWSAVVEALRGFQAWHSAKMRMDPVYPIALAAGSAALLDIFLPAWPASRVLKGFIGQLLGAVSMPSNPEPESDWDY